MARTKQGISAEQMAAIQQWAYRHGRKWKADLREAWMSGNYGEFEGSNYLQQVRNERGPSWLVGFRLPELPASEPVEPEPELGDFGTPVSAYPPAAQLLADLEAREGLPDWVHQSITHGESAAAKAKRAKEYQNFRLQLAADLVRYDDVRTRGEAALSRYDVETCASGNADLAVRTAIALKHNHCSYAVFHLAYMRVKWPAMAQLLDRESLLSIKPEPEPDEDDVEACAVCGCLPCSCEEPCEACGQAECECEPQPDLVARAGAPVQLSLFGGGL